MEKHHHKFLMGYNVRYVGERNAALGKKNAWGTVVGYVKNAPKELVIDFGSDTYILNEDDLAPYVFTEKEKGPEVVKISKKWDDP